MKSWLSFSDLFLRWRSGAIDLSNARFERIVSEASAVSWELEDRSPKELRQIAGEWDGKIRANDRSAKAVAAIREAARRALGITPYDVQLLAALAMCQRRVVEMETGEGKTLAAAISACLQVTTGTDPTDRHVHVLTFNDYLARRDAQWMGPLYDSLGIRVGYVEEGMTRSERRAAYDCSVTYITAKQAGFDYLRDQLCRDPEDSVQGPLDRAIVDEADSILIDEARVPLVIAAESEEESGDLFKLAQIVHKLSPDRDYSISGGWRNASFTDSGLHRLQGTLKCGQLHSEKNATLLARLHLALQAEVLLKRDVDYLVRDDEAVLIDEFTGRVAENRRWPHGLQAAVEAKEGLPIRPQGTILQSVTLQNYLSQYEHLAGMTGTAREAAEELQEFYDLRLTIVPRHADSVRIDQPDAVFATKHEKLQALIEVIRQQYVMARPVLVGTSSVEESELVAHQLRKASVPCRVLNANNDRREAEIIAESGASGAVTISTNMAGRGTDIRLGGADEHGRQTVVAVGGLYVIGLNRHESRRIDNQLRGRAGRQGDPGETRFFVSLEDDLLIRHGAAEVPELREALVPGTDALNEAEDTPGNSARQSLFHSRLAHLQRVIEGESFEIRRTLHKYSMCLERQRIELGKYRQPIFHRQELPTVFQQRAESRYNDLVGRFGAELVGDVSRLILLAQIDHHWAEHLEHAGHIRDGIHLISMGGFNAFDEFNRQINRAFRSLRESIEAESVALFVRGKIDENGIDLHREGLGAPSATWTYMINDNPTGDVLQRLSSGIKRIFQRTVGRI